MTGLGTAIKNLDPAIKSALIITGVPIFVGLGAIIVKKIASNDSDNDDDFEDDE